MDQCGGGKYPANGRGGGWYWEPGKGGEVQYGDRDHQRPREWSGRGRLPTGRAGFRRSALVPAMTALHGFTPPSRPQTHPETGNGLRRGATASGCRSCCWPTWQTRPGYRRGRPEAESDRQLRCRTKCEQDRAALSSRRRTELGSGSIQTGNGRATTLLFQPPPGLQNRLQRVKFTEICPQASP